MTHILDKIDINDLTEKWYYPKHTNIRIRKVENNIEIAQIGYFDDSLYYEDDFGDGVK